MISDATFGIVYGETSSIPFLRADPIDRSDMEAYNAVAGLERYASIFTPTGAANFAKNAIPEGIQLAKSSKVVRELAGSVDEAARFFPNKIKPSFVHGQSDGGKGVWSYNSRTSGSGSTWAQYQSQISGAPDGTEYLVKTDLMPSGQKWFDGYDPDRNVLLDAKRYLDWPKENLPFSINKVVEDARMESAIAKQLKTKVEWHIPNQEKAELVEQLLRENRIKHVNVVYSPIGE
ncbi:Tox-REase-5 domain-containing protein [Photobacterium alginatilyticum]|uniref:Tox-REase-5 domain-containing protein n=1 Tax=Photobacterium alginatilyticum TaxID=1775171 RepID=UPI0040695FCF